MGNQDGGDDGEVVSSFAWSCGVKTRRKNVLVCSEMGRCELKLMSIRFGQRLNQLPPYLGVPSVIAHWDDDVL